MALAHLLGSTPHISLLLRKARRLGYGEADDLLDLAVARGCRHYAPSGQGKAAIRDCGREMFTNEELAVALVSGSLEGDARHVRVAGQLLGAPGMSAAKVARLARMERCVPIIQYIAEVGARENPDDPSFWKSLLEQLPASTPIPEGRMPHPSRFMSQPGWSPPSRPVRRASWLRAHG
jgi:hypothetical protein